MGPSPLRSVGYGRHGRRVDRFFLDHEPDTTMAHEPITVSFTALQESPELLGDALERALGPSGLGVVIVNGMSIPR